MRFIVKLRVGSLISIYCPFQNRIPELVFDKRVKRVINALTKEIL